MSNPAVRELLQDLARHPALAEAVRRLDRAAAGERVDLSGLTTTAKAVHLVLIWQLTGKPLLVVTDGNRQAESLFESLATFFELLVEDTHARPQLLPALDVLPHQNLSPHSELVERRAVGLWRLATGAAPVTVTPVGSLLLKTASANSYRQLALHLAARDEIPMEDFVAHLESIGYEHREPVEMVGEFSVRGGIIDVFPAEASKPLRIEFFGDEIESLRRFEVESQRSVAKVSSATILPLSELPRTRGLLTRAAEMAGASRAPLPGELFPGWEYWVPLVEPRTDSLLSLAPQNLLVWDEIEQCHAAADRLWKRLDDAAEADPDVRELALNEASFFRWGELQLAATERPRLLLRELGLEAPGSLEIRSQPSPGFRGSIREAVQQARQFVEKGNRVAFFAPSTGETERLADIFQEYELPFQLVERKAGAAARAYEAGEVAGVLLLKGAVGRGVVFPESRLALFGTDDLFEAPEAVARPAAVRADLGAFAADIADLRPGDLVVHTTHGVGRFRGVKEIAQGDQTGDFMLIEYAGDSKLYVPLTRMDLIQKYRGGESGAPLDKLGGVTWARTKSKVKAKMRDMADELLKLYAQRRMAAGFAFSPDSNWQREFEDAFEFSATKDQTQATTEIKRDMQSDQPMDRLLCGDVGFGKTEVAMRAAFKALGDGKQVAVLAPTTVLAFQHYETFRRRFAAFPVRIELLSRFRSAKEIKQVLADLAAGKVDLLIGTHRLLSKDVEFADLGLLVVDEEQRFGVRHKERLKQIRANVDSLTMSATPIPRTLHMSLLGIRDMSVIETPPKDRLAIHTVVSHFEPGLIKTAIEQELSRGGQVYFIHNRIESIFSRAAFLQELVPECRIGVGHGQMGEQELERVLLGFMRHEYDVFCCTTIVENGIDVPLANTIIIENAERHGLSELYQLRGRVGRSNRRAYAYLLVPPDAQLSDVARKRLAALKEFSDLGAGFRIAALDLELRGAGNILGGEQHGHIAAVGFDMYVRLLDEAVRELKGEEIPPEVHTNLTLGLDIRIPAEYISDENQRLRAYKKIADLKDSAGVQPLLEEFADRYGPPPPQLELLARFALLKTEAERLGVESVDRRQGFFNFKFHPEAKVDPQRLMDLVRRTPQAQFTPAGVLRLPVPAGAAESALLDALAAQLAALRA